MRVDNECENKEEYDLKEEVDGVFEIPDGEYFDEESQSGDAACAEGEVEKKGVCHLEKEELGPAELDDGDDVEKDDDESGETSREHLDKIPEMWIRLRHIY